MNQLVLDLPASPARRVQYPPGATCSMDGCSSKPKAKWLCLKHYTRLIKHGDASVSLGHARKYAVGQACLVEGCDEQADSRGWCTSHYHRWARTGDPCGPDGRSLRQPTHLVCTVDGCKTVPVAKGLCSTHYDRQRRLGDALAEPLRQFTGLTCRALDCADSQSSRGFCDKHYRAFRRSNFTEAEWHLHRMQRVAASQRRRARVRSARKVDYKWSAVMDRMAYFGYRCWMCGGPFEHVDHVKPLAQGGVDCPANFRPACGSCNSAKGAKWYGVANLHRFLRVPKAA